jgi:hypothetical protein
MSRASQEKAQGFRLRCRLSFNLIQAEERRLTVISYSSVFSLLSDALKEIQMDAVYVVITVLFFVLCGGYVFFLSGGKS